MKGVAVQNDLKGSEKTIAIVGAGPAAKEFLTQCGLILRHALQRGQHIDPSKISFTVFDKNSVPGPGAPYSVSSSHYQHVSNQPPQNMSYKDDRDPQDEEGNPIWIFVCGMKK